MLRIITALFLLIVPGIAAADAPLLWVPVGYQQIAVLTTSQSLTVPAGAVFAVFTPEAQAIRYRDDGIAPTALVGMPVAVGVSVQYTATLSKVQFIEQTAGAKLNVSYYR